MKVMSAAPKRSPARYRRPSASNLLLTSSTTAINVSSDVPRRRIDAHEDRITLAAARIQRAAAPARGRGTPWVIIGTVSFGDGIWSK
ncbi:MAG: hypothetical protein IPJ62_14770 [Betaproteobacteria bacterium]|nr:hypothetical protein [Betaproteobacteria bacterium]